MDEHDDRAIALSMAQAVEADAELIAALIREDEQAKRDFEFAMQLDEDSDATPETDDDVIHGGLDEETYRTLHAFNVVVQPTENTEVEMELGSEENHDAMSGGEEDETDDENNPDEDLKGDADNQSDYIASQEDVSQMDEDEIQAEEIQPEETQTEETQGERDADEHPGTAQVTSPAPSELHVETKECLYCSDELPKDEVYEAPCSHGMCQPCLIRSIQTAMKDESIFPPKCCGQAIPVDNTNAFITEDLLTEYDNKREEFETTNRTYCSDKTCSAFIPTRFIEAGIAQCTRCEGRTCLNCLSESHEGTCTDDPESQRHVAATTNSVISAESSGKPATALNGTRNTSWPEHQHRQQHNWRSPSSPFNAVTETTLGLTVCAVKKRATIVRNGRGDTLCVAQIVISRFAFHVSWLADTSCESEIEVGLVL
ncbi:hypothetical protein Forpe1208_v012853 [Fusarium oxysporum f. sp. rapae]|uniref:IBR domain-containing protein n=1 Tax=Fusarium oxysporum f. sp. rapae TaxID=485398 RepID=A0A8J5NLY7_FUSOX|nr:hypothetical protein Forpe1208_v012853 [Fusarium oxysporum f. sp. rapae]